MTDTHTIAPTNVIPLGRGFPRLVPGPGAAYHAFDEACREFIATQPSRSEADFEIGRLVGMADSIVMNVRQLQPLHNSLECIARFDAKSVAGQFVDAMDLDRERAGVLQAAVDRRIPTPRLPDPSVA